MPSKTLSYSALRSNSGWGSSGRGRGTPSPLASRQYRKSTREEVQSLLPMSRSSRTLSIPFNQHSHLGELNDREWLSGGRRASLAVQKHSCADTSYARISAQGLEASNVGWRYSPAATQAQPVQAYNEERKSSLLGRISRATGAMISRSPIAQTSLGHLPNGPPPPKPKRTLRRLIGLETGWEAFQ
jgi:hypothetical protein